MPRGSIGPYRFPLCPLRIQLRVNRLFPSDFTVSLVEYRRLDPGEKETTNYCDGEIQCYILVVAVVKHMTITSCGVRYSLYFF